jgi:hypothetical protein
LLSQLSLFLKTTNTWNKKSAPLIFDKLAPLKSIFMNKTIPFYIILLAFTAFTFISCKSKNEYQTGFKVASFEAKFPSDTTHAFEQQCSKYFNEGWMKFYEGDTVTALSRMGNFTFGTWKENEDAKKITLELKELGKFELNKEIQLGENDELEYLILKGKNAKGAELKLLLKKDDYFEFETKDLLSFAWNKWRVKPTKKESKEQIKSRVLAQIDYMNGYFTLLDEREYTSFFESHLTSPYKFYSNGISLDPSYLTEYNNIFYDYNDAAEAYNYLKGGLNSVVKYPSDNKTYNEGYVKALKEIRQFIVLK